MVVKKLSAGAIALGLACFGAALSLHTFVHLALWNAAFVVTSVVLALTLAVAWYSQRRTLGRMASLQAVVEEIGEHGDISARLPAEGSDQVAQLGIAVNRLLTVIEENGPPQRPVHLPFDHSENRYRTLFDQAPVGVMTYDCDLRILDCNERLVQLLQSSRSKLVGLDMWHLHDQRILPALQGTLKGRMTTYDGPYEATTSGANIWISMQFAPLQDAHGRVVGGMAVVEDVTERKQADARLDYLAYHDVLTGLSSRAILPDYLHQVLLQARQTGGRVALLFLDLDRFKLINDTLGHGTGDLLLQLVAQRLKSCVPEPGRVVRMGGDEFTVILPGVQAGEESRVAEAILGVLRQPFLVMGRELFVTTTIGISLYPNHGADAATLLKNADTAMYQAKALGKNTLQFYAPIMHDRAFEKLAMEHSLRRALERKELLVYYQPQVSCTTRKVVNIEALVRWEHPQHGLVNPGDFIGLAEETGLIIPIGEWVLHTACLQAVAWQRAGLLTGRIAVNVSVRQFHHPNFVHTVLKVLRETGLPPKLLELEVTENMIMHPRDENVEKLAELRRRGIHISIDDFGTGYSSLNYLRRFPIDAIKIDRSFVSDINATLDGSSNDAAIIVALTAMAKSLGLLVIAEGVETEEQAIFLGSLHCAALQGYLFSEPLSASDSTEFLQNGVCSMELAG